MSHHDDDLPDPLDLLQRLEDLERHAELTSRLMSMLRIVYGPNLELLLTRTSSTTTDEEVLS